MIRLLQAGLTAASLTQHAFLWQPHHILAAHPRLDLGWEVRYDRALLEHDCNAEADLSA